LRQGESGFRFVSELFTTPAKEPALDCKNISSNMKDCNCTYEPCSRKGKCCECLAYHRRSGELPACYFTAAQERTYDRSIGHFLRCNQR